MSDPFILDTLKDFLTDEVLATLLKKCKSFLKSRMLIQESLRIINFDSDCDDFKKLIEDAFNVAASKEICKKVPAADLIETLKSNIDSITGWVYFPSPKFDMEVLKPANYDYEKEILAFLNILYEQIKSKRDSYTSFTMPQIRSLLKDGFDGVNENIKQTSIFLATQYTTGVNEIKQTILGLASDKENVKESLSQDEHFPEIESLILSRDYKKAFELLKFIKESVEKENIKEKKVKLYELYIMYFLREETHQEEALPYIERLLENQKDNEGKQHYIVLELILSKEYNKVIEYIDAQFKVCPESKQKVKNELFELRINALLLDKRTDEALNYVNNIRKEYKDSLYWLSRIYNLMGRYENAVKLIKENPDYFNIDFNKKLQKIESCYLFFVQKYSEEGYNPSDFEKINKLIAESILLAEEAKDDFKATETILLAQAMLYRIISDNEKSLIAFEKLKEIGSQNPNFLRNYPIELIQTHANLSNAEKEVILNYFRKFLSIYPEDNIIHDAYYVTWLNTDECKATEEIERLPFVKQNLRSKILLINVYVKHFEIDKAEKLIENLEFQFPDCLELNIARKNLLVHKKNLPEAIKECEKALEKCKDKLYRLDIIKDLLRLELSVQNLQLSQIGKLVELINSVENKYERLNLYGYELVYCRMYQKKNEEAIKVIKQIRSFGLIKSEIVSEEIFINFTTRNYQKVLKLFKEFDALKGVRGERENKIYIWSLLGLGEDEKVKNAVEYLDLSGKPEEYVFASQQLLNLGKPELSIKLAHAGYLKYRDNVKVVEQFFASILSKQFDSLPPEIQKDAIQCRDEYFKFPEQERNIHQFKIDLNGNVLQQISDIVHDFSLDRRGNIDFSELIEKKHLPLSILTSKGLNYLHIWKSSQILQNYNNWTINQIQEKKISVDSFNDVIIDLPSLVTCSYLDILDYLPLIFKTIYIPQNSIDEIEKVIKTKNNPLLTDFYSCLYTMNKNEYPRQKVDSSDIAVMAEKLIRFIKREDIIKVGEQLEPKQEIPDKLKVLFEQSNLIEDEAISFCIKSKISIMLESAVYRLVLNEIIPDTVTLSIFDILNELLASGKIKPISYVLLLSKLIKGKYVCIPFNYFVVFQYIRYFGYIVSDEVKEIIDSFSDSKIYNPVWILNQITIFIVMLWNTDIPFDNKSKLTLSFYKAMAKRGDIPFGTLFFYNKVIYKLIKTFQYQSEFRDFWRLYSEEIRLSFHMKRV